MNNLHKPLDEVDSMKVGSTEQLVHNLYMLHHWLAIRNAISPIQMPPLKSMTRSGHEKYPGQREKMVIIVLSSISEAVAGHERDHVTDQFAIILCLVFCQFILLFCLLEMKLRYSCSLLSVNLPLYL